MTTKTLVYIGATAPFFESAVTGRPQAWYPNQVSDLPTAQADLLLATGLFVLRDRLPAPNFVVSTDAPSDEDGRPDGTIYFHIQP